MKILATTKAFWNGDAHLLECCMCGENDRNKLLIEDMGIADGIAGDNYSFCKKCWNKPHLGKRLIEFLGYNPEFGLKIVDKNLDLEEIK